MNSGEKQSILLDVDNVLAGKQLLDQPRALLLLRLCQFTLLFTPDKTEHYWQLSLPLQARVPPELQEELKALRSTLEESLPAGCDGDSDLADAPGGGTAGPVHAWWHQVSRQVP